MNYSLFSFSCAVDWIDIEVQFTKHTNFPSVQNALRGILALPENYNSYVEPQNKSSGGAATVFIFRIQDPKNLIQITETLRKLEEHFSPFATQPRITGIEIAFDAYSRGASREELAELAARFYKFMTKPVSVNQRLYRDFKGSVQGIPAHSTSLVRHLIKGHQIGIGNKSTDQYQHIYLKEHDNKLPLPEKEHRARTEITLRCSGLPFHTIEEFKNFDFANLAVWFKFRKLKDNLDQLATFTMESAVQVGEKKKRKRKEGGTREYGKHTEANIALNRIAYDSLRELTRRFKT